jgi:hypothetical protein
MNDRATLEGGTFEIVSARGKGAQIKVTLPAIKSAKTRETKNPNASAT